MWSRHAPGLALAAAILVGGAPRPAPASQARPALEPLQPGMRQACELAVRRLLERDPALMDAPPSPRLLLLEERAPSPGGAAALDRAVRWIGNLLFARNLRVTVVVPPPGGAGGDPLAGAARDAVWEVGLEGDEERQVVRLRARGEPGAVAAVPFVEKPWVGDPDGFVRAHRERAYFTGRSGPEGSPAAAREAAIRDAFGKVGESLLRGIEVEGAPGAGTAAPRLRTRLAKAFASPIIMNKYLDDCYLGESSRPYGKIWRGHALVAMSEEDFQAWRARAASWAASSRRSTLVGLAAMLLVAGVVAGLFLKVDAATRGYLRAWLATAAVGTIVAAGALVILVVG